jgi:hypothetical protein
MPLNNISLKRQLANRSNAQRSTGPKSEGGKRIASQNAVRHRLSVPLSAAVLTPLREEVASLLIESGIPSENVDDLAEKIIEFERNMAVFRQIEGNRLAGQQEGHPADVGGFPERSAQKNIAFASLAETKWGESDKMMHRLEYKALQQAAKFLLKQDGKRNRQTAIDLDRYLRRAGNQLIKALCRAE